MIAPKPTSENITITFSEMAKNVKIYVTDAEGRMISVYHFDSPTEEQLKLGVSPDVYFINVLEEDQLSRMRCVKN